MALILLIFAFIRCGLSFYFPSEPAPLGAAFESLQTQDSQQATQSVGGNSRRKIANSDASEQRIEKSRPTPPLALAEPPAESSELGRFDLSNEDSKTLDRLASSSVREGQFRNAVQFQYWSMKNGDGHSGVYNLACYYSLAGKSEASFYWLQQAAEKQGVDAAWASEDTDLQKIHLDPRWPAVLKYLEEYNRFWELSDVSETFAVIPANYDATKPIPVVLGLHGLGSRAKGFVSPEFQEWADELNIAIVGVSGSRPRGPASFVWSEDPEIDLRRIDAAIDELKDRLTVKEGSLMLFGFSQGAMMSAEIAIRHPDRFAGALVMSPGGIKQPDLAQLTKLEGNQNQVFVFVCGAGEAPGNVSLARDYAKTFSEFECKVEHKAYPGVSQHTYPPDFSRKFPTWVKSILDQDQR
jgi:predicted esterase